VRIAVHQMTSGALPATNVSEMIGAVEAAARGGAAMYFAPEMSIMVNRKRDEARLHIFNEAKTESIERFGEVATRNNIWVHLGSIPVVHDTGPQLANRSVVISAKGQIEARYDKIHLFDVDLKSGESWRESSAYVGGDTPVILNTPLGKMGLAVCYDIRFPDLFSAYAKAGVDIITLPSAFTVPTGAAHWHALLRARAIESECFVIAAAQCGLHEDGRETYGHSLVVDPWGKVILDMGTTPGLAFVDLNLDKIPEVRQQIPVHQNRRAIAEPRFYE
jgi:deaminated glutathione amidase